MVGKRCSYSYSYRDLEAVVFLCVTLLDSLRPAEVNDPVGDAVVLSGRVSVQGERGAAQHEPVLGPRLCEYKGRGQWLEHVCAGRGAGSVDRIRLCGEGSRVSG